MFEKKRNVLPVRVVQRLEECSFGRVISRFCQDYSGIAALEFALLVPFLLALYLGALEMSQILTVDRRVTLLANAAADLVAQTETVNNDELANIYELTEAILYPYEASKVSVVITSVVADEDNKTTVDWSWSKSGLNPEDAPTSHAEGASYTLPGGGKLTHAYSSVIIAEVSYPYRPQYLTFLPDPISMSDTYYLRPRKSLKVEKTD